MIKKLAIGALAFLGAAQANPSSFYIGAGLGYVGGKAPIMTSRKVYDQIVATHPNRGTENVYANVRLPTKGSLNGAATRLTLGYTCNVSSVVSVGGDISFGLTGPQKKSRISFELLRGPYGTDDLMILSRRLHDKGNLTFTARIGAKMGPVRPYLTGGFALHSFKFSESCQIFSKMSQASTYAFNTEVSYSEERKKTRLLFVIGLGAEYTVSKNISVGAEWLHRRGTLGVYKTAQKERALFVDTFGIGRLNESNKIYMNEFVLTCKYSLPVSH
jgi:opacity protein-like surface antigen